MSHWPGAVYDPTGTSPVAYSHQKPRYRPQGFWPRWRLRLTTLAMLALPLLSWRFGTAEMARWSFVPGVILTCLGLGLRMWAAGWLRKHESLMTDGPYALTRHPLYLGTGCITLGQSLMSGIPLAPFLFPVLWLALYCPAMREEEAFLSGVYGDIYAGYRARVPFLVPCFRFTRSADRPKADGGAMQCRRFSWQQVWRNREYEAAITNAVVIIAYSYLSLVR